MVSAEDIIQIHTLFQYHSISMWVNGGWGVDMLLGEQTRPHKDLDFLLDVKDVPMACAILGHQGYVLNWLWEENRWIWTLDAMYIPTGFVMEDPFGRQMDIHAVWFDDSGYGIPAWEDDSGFTFDQIASVAQGRVGNYHLPCYNAELQLQCHRGYELPQKHIDDIERLTERFALTF